MSEVNATPETIQIVPAGIRISNDTLATIRERIVQQSELINATEQLVKAARKILEIEDIFRIGDQVESWEAFLPKTRAVEVTDIPEIICEGLNVEFDSDHPTLVAVNKDHGNFNAHVDGFEMDGSRVVVSGWGEMYDYWEPKTSFSCIVDTSLTEQETKVHIITHTPQESQDEDIRRQAEDQVAITLVESLSAETPTQSA